MRFPGFIGPSYTLQSVNVDCQRCVNFYPEINEVGTGKEREVASLVPTPGLRLLNTLGDGPIRGIYTSSDGTLFAVSGAKLYSLDSNFDETELGSLATTEGPVSMADDGFYLVVVDGDNGYTWKLAAEEFTQIADEDFLGADQVTYQDGYFIFNQPDSGRFYISDPNDGAYETAITFNALDFGSAEGSPDRLVGLISDHQNLFLFGAVSTEIFYDSGDADSPFVRTQGAIIEVGCAAAFSIAKLQNAVYWLGQDETGRGIVYRAKGFQPERISTHAIETVISKLGDLSDARAWVYQQAGHAFYCLNLPDAETTWVFDATTNLWHERAYLSLGAFARHRADCHASAYGENVVGDYETGKIYALDIDKYSDDGDPILRERTAPHFTSGLKRLFHKSFQVDMETGVGIDGIGQGVDPQAMLQWSDDGGNSWSNEHWADIGRIGARHTRVNFRRLGASRDRVYRFRVSDPVKTVLIGAEMDVEEGVA